MMVLLVAYASILLLKTVLVKCCAFHFAAFASTAGGLRTCNAAAFTSAKKYAAHFLAAAAGGTEVKEAAYAGTGG